MEAQPRVFLERHVLSILFTFRMAQVDKNYHQCAPTKMGGPHFVYKPSAELQ
jgi:hypothetical protein